VDGITRDAGEEMIEMISVEDRLPPDDDPVILIDCNQEMVAVGFYMGKGRVLQEGFWRINDEGCAERFLSVTHWLKITEFPKKSS
jgi:hypothetical protein